MGEVLGRVGLAPLLKTERNTAQGCFPVKLLDYLAHGLWIAGSDLFVVRQVVRPGENGFLFPPGNRLGLASFADASLATLGPLPASPLLPHAAANHAALPSTIQREENSPRCIRPRDKCAVYPEAVNTQCATSCGVSSDCRTRAAFRSSSRPDAHLATLEIPAHRC